LKSVWPSRMLCTASEQFILALIED
jgi:hypothetical protein